MIIFEQYKQQLFPAHKPRLSFDRVLQQYFFVLTFVLSFSDFSRVYGIGIQIRIQSWMCWFNDNNYVCIKVLTVRSRIERLQLCSLDRHIHISISNMSKWVVSPQIVERLLVSSSSLRQHESMSGKAPNWHSNEFQLPLTFAWRLKVGTLLLDLEQV